jgi:cytoskeletal protein CcmA (bactofilin family)
MFGKKKEQSGASSGATTLIAVGTALTGDVSFCGNLEIEGTVIGNITGTGEDSRVRVLNSGSVVGDIVAATLMVNGSIKGDLYATKLIKLASKAVVEGNLNYKLIEIDKGAEVVGTFVYHQPSTNVTQFPADSKEFKQ